MEVEDIISKSDYMSMLDKYSKLAIDEMNGDAARKVDKIEYYQIIIKEQMNLCNKELLSKFIKAINK